MNETISVGILEAARMLGISPSTIRRLIKNSEIKAFKIGNRDLILITELHRLVEAKTAKVVETHEGRVFRLNPDGSLEDTK